jgi:hypothetical protein
MRLLGSIPNMGRQAACRAVGEECRAGEPLKKLGLESLCINLCAPQSESSAARRLNSFSIKPSSLIA